MLADKEVILIPRRLQKTERLKRKIEKRQEDKHKHRETDDEDQRSKREFRGKRDMIEGDSRDIRQSNIQYCSPRSNLNVYRLN